jgi:cytochrome b pre-mRNA-processing protein 3
MTAGKEVSTTWSRGLFPDRRRRGLGWTRALAMAYGVAVDPVSIGWSLIGTLGLPSVSGMGHLARGSGTKGIVVGLLSLIRRGRHERVGFELYGAAVAAARDPYFYTVLGVPDTLDGRFDMVGLHTFLLIQRLKRESPRGPALAQAVFDAMFSDMDINLREMGVGDLSVGRKVRVMWEAFHGRAAAYAAAMAAGDVAGLEAALNRNVWRGNPPSDAATAALARIVLSLEAHLAALEFSGLARGVVDFPRAEDANR